MTTVMPVALFVSPKEYALSLSEIDLVRENPDGGTEWRRCQVLIVIRNDRLARYEEDIGPRIPVDGFRIIGGDIDDSGVCHLDHTVGELKEIAKEYRQRLIEEPMDMDELPRNDLIGLYHDYVDIKKRAASGTKSFLGVK